MTSAGHACGVGDQMLLSLACDDCRDAKKCAEGRVLELDPLLRKDPRKCELQMLGNFSWWRQLSC